MRRGKEEREERRSEKVSFGKETLGTRRELLGRRQMYSRSENGQKLCM